MNREQRRALIALTCRIALADGVVTPEERELVHGMVARFGGQAVTGEEADRWLDSAAPAADFGDLPAGVDKLFVAEAIKLMEVDGDVADSEVQALGEILARVFDRSR